VKSYHELEVWQKSYGLALAIYKATSAFPKSEVFGLTSQVRRAAVSIPANIAEGHCRHTRADFLRFLSIAQGSAGELETLLSLARDLPYLNSEVAAQLLAQLTEVGKMLTGLTQSLRNPRPESGPLAPSP